MIHRRNTHQPAILTIAFSLLLNFSNVFAAPSDLETVVDSRDRDSLLHLNDDAWINDIGTLLYNDQDEDGYFSGLSLSVDADSDFSSFEAYVAIDILSELDVAEDRVGERLHTTRTFDLYGRSVSDEYRIDIDLVQNYSPGVYDLRISLVDAHDNRILDQVGAQDFRNLRSLSLESEDNQTVYNPVFERPLQEPNDDIAVTEYAGSTGLGAIAFLIASLLIKINSSRTQRSTQHAARSTQHAARSTQHAARSTQMSR